MSGSVVGTLRCQETFPRGRERDITCLGAAPSQWLPTISRLSPQLRTMMRAAPSSILVLNKVYGSVLYLTPSGDQFMGLMDHQTTKTLSTPIKQLSASIGFLSRRLSRLAGSVQGWRESRAGRKLITGRLSWDLYKCGPAETTNN